MKSQPVKNEKDRSLIKCFWESQPTGCTKGAHCPFLHVNNFRPYDDPYVPEAVVPPTIFPISGGKIIVNKTKLNEIALSNPAVATAAQNRTVLPPRIPIKQRLGHKKIVEEDAKTELFEYDSEEESLRKGAISTIDLRKRLSSKRRHSTSLDEASDIETEVKIRSVVKKVKKPVKEKKRKKEKKAKKDLLREISPIPKKNNDAYFDDDSDESNDTLAQRIAAQRERKRSKSGTTTKKNRTKSSPEQRSVEIVPTDKISRSSDKKNRSKTKGGSKRQTSLSQDDKDSVRSVIDDVDALLNSSAPLPLSDTSAKNAANESHDVMKELDELINS